MLLTSVALQRLFMSKSTMAEETLANEFRAGTYSCVGCNAVLYSYVFAFNVGNRSSQSALGRGESDHISRRCFSLVCCAFGLTYLFCVFTCACVWLHSSGDKFRSVGKWPAFRKAATPEAIKLVQDDFGGDDILCSKCLATIGQLYHDGKKAGDEHPEAKDRHCVESKALTFDATDPNEPAPQLPSNTPSIKLNVSEQLERPTTPPLGVPQSAVDNKKLKQGASAKKPAAASSSASPASKPRSATKSKDSQVESSAPSTAVIGAVALAGVAIISIGAWLGWRQLSNKKKN